MSSLVGVSPSSPNHTLLSECLLLCIHKNWALISCCRLCSICVHIYSWAACLCKNLYFGTGNIWLSLYWLVSQTPTLGPTQTAADWELLMQFRADIVWLSFTVPHNGLQCFPFKSRLQCVWIKANLIRERLWGNLLYLYTDTLWKMINHGARCAFSGVWVQSFWTCGVFVAYVLYKLHSSSVAWI